jgi:NADH dehydrogenase
MADGEHRVVIIGGGFGGLYCARALNGSPVRVTLIDRRNFHLFQPLLYQVATGGLSPANIASPLRSILRKQRNARTLLAEVSGFDTAGKRVLTADGDAVPYDTLVLATGSSHHYFGHDDWEPHAPGLKTVEDATEIRKRVLSAFEKAEREPDAEVRKRLLTFAVVGGGPTGVEMAGTIAELARVTLRRDFRAIDPAGARVVLVEGQPRVLPMFVEKLSARALQMLRDLGVEVHLDCHVTEVGPHAVQFQSDSGKAPPQRIDTETVVWAAGVKASPLGRKLAEALGPGVEVDKAGRVTVAEDCSVPGHPNVFVVGDLALFKQADGKPLPGLAPVAMQQGKYVAKVIDRRLRGKSPPAVFRYWDRGTMATIGRNRAVADVHWFRFSGWFAWLAWLFVHIMYLAKFENRLLVMIQWFWNYVSRNRTARLITGQHALDELSVRREATSAAPANGPPASSARTWN